MIPIIAQATVNTGIPLWAILLSTLLTGGGGAALFQVIQKRMEHKAGASVADSTANLNDVAALNTAITGLSNENNRLYEKVSLLGGQLDLVREELAKRPTKEDLKSDVARLEESVVGLKAQLQNSLADVSRLERSVLDLKVQLITAEGRKGQSSV